MKHLVLYFCIFYSVKVFSNLSVPNLPEEGVVEPDNQKTIDPNIDYEQFQGRVTDKDKTGRIFKIKVENNNTKFFRAGDEVNFRVNQQETERPCNATVKSIEDYYFVIYVNKLENCWNKDRYFPRGMQLNFQSKILSKRILEASSYRKLLIERKEGYLKQLNKINHFVWTYEQQKMKTAAEFDEKINELRRQRQLAVDNLIQEKQEKVLLQDELIKKLDEIDQNLDFYKVERTEYITDRWNLDHDLGHPFGQRPQDMKNP